MSKRHTTLVFSFWAWLILAPPFITAWGGYANAAALSDRLIGLVIAIAVHLLLGVAFLLAGLVERRVPGLWRWGWFLVALVALAALRPYLADVLQLWAGLELEPPALLIRFALNIIGLGVILLIVYLAFEQVEHHADIRRRLAAVIHRVRQQGTDVEVRHATLIVEYQRTIVDPLRRALDDVDASQSRVEVAEQLMRVAHDVVRPLTDRTFAMDHAGTGYHYRPPGGLLTEGGRRRTGPQRIEATLPWAPGAVWFALQLPMAVVAFDLLLGIATALASTLVVTLGAWAIRLHPLPSRPTLAITLLALEYGTLGLLGTLVILSPDFTVAGLGIWVYGVLLYAVAGTTLSIGSSKRLDYLADDQQLVNDLLDAKARTNRAQAILSQTTNLLARRLHAAIQADVVAAALQLRLGHDDPAATITELEQRIARVLEAPMLPSAVDSDHSDRPYPESIRTAVLAAHDAWCEALDLRSDYDDELWDWLADHPWCAAIVRDVSTRALTNVIRHSRTRSATLSMRVHDGRLHIEIRHRGRVLSRDHRLSGVGAFAARTQVAELVQEGGEIVYRVIA